MAIRTLPQVKTRRYTADEVWAMACDPANEGRYFYLIDGELHEDPMPNRVHSRLAVRIGRYLDIYAEETGLGESHVEGDHRPADRSQTLLRPDVSFTKFDRLADSPLTSYIRTLPNIAVEIKSPSNTMSELRRKAETYLRHGGEIVWLVLPEREGIEQWMLDEDGRTQSQFIDRDDELSGGGALPGFTLPLHQLFPHDSGERQ